VTTIDRRKADRVDAGFPVELTTQRKFVEGEVKDLSRSGIRVRLSTLALGMTMPLSTTDAGKGVSALLADSFSLNLHHKKLGTLLPRAVSLTRVGIPTDEAGMLDLCCKFDSPLGDAEGAMLDVSLPPFNDSVQEWCDDLPACVGEVRFGEAESATTVPVPSPAEAPIYNGRDQRFRAFVSSKSPDGPPALFCHTDLVTGFAVRVRVAREAALGTQAAEPVTLQHASQAFVEAFGNAVDLRLVGASGDLWSGPVRVSGVELQPTEMLVTLAFDRKLRLSEMRNLGLRTDAA